VVLAGLESVKKNQQVPRQDDRSLGWSLTSNMIRTHRGTAGIDAFHDA